MTGKTVAQVAEDGIEKRKKSASRMGKLTKNMLEIGVQSAVVSTLVPGAAAGVGQVYSGMLPVMTMKTMADEISGGAVDLSGKTIVGTQRKLSNRYKIVQTKALSEPKACVNGHAFDSGEFAIRRGGLDYCSTCGKQLFGVYGPPREYLRRNRR